VCSVYLEGMRCFVCTVLVCVPGRYALFCVHCVCTWKVCVVSCSLVVLNLLSHEARHKITYLCWRDVKNYPANNSCYLCNNHCTFIVSVLLLILYLLLIESFVQEPFNRLMRWCSLSTVSSNRHQMDHATSVVLMSGMSSAEQNGILSLRCITLALSPSSYEVR